MRIAKLLPAAFILLLVPLFSCLCHAQVPEGVAPESLPIDPHKTWKVLETEHFEVIYDESDRALAQDFANEAERANTLLQPIIKTPPHKKIPLVLADVTDDSNGSATAIPAPDIEIYPVLPSVFDPTSEYFKWSREVIQHEYTHILNFEPVSGFMKVLRFVFGSIITPDGYLPRWYTEGLAVEMESRLTPVGRGRSHYYSAFVRSMVEDGAWGKGEGVDRIGATTIPTWPRGQRPYTYGYFLMHRLSELTMPDPRYAADQGPGVYSLLDHRYGARIPWIINQPPIDYFDRDWAGLLGDMYDEMRTKAQAQLKTLADSGAKKGTPLAQSGYFNFGAVISPDHLKMAAIVQDFDQYPSIRIWTRAKDTDPFALEKDIPKATTNAKDVHQISWRSDNDTLVYDHSDTWRHFDTYDDLYEYDVASKKEKRLTEGMRAREATVMPDNSLVFIVATSSKTILMHANADGSAAQVLYEPGPGERVSSPRPYGDGVIFSHRSAKGREWIESYSMSTKARVALTQSSKVGEIHMMPVADPADPKAFYFAASTSGAMNIYWNDGRGLNGRNIAITNTSTYAAAPAIDVTAKQVIYTRLTSNGFELEAGPLATTQPGSAAQPAQIDSLQKYPAADESDPPQAEIKSEHSYHGVSYLFPQYLLPFLYIVPGGVIAEVSSSGNDPLNHHTYSFDVGYDSRANQPWEDFSYTNGTFPFLIDLTLSNDFVYLVGAGTTEQVVYGYLDTRHFLLPNSNKWIVGPEVQYRSTSFPNPPFANVVATQAGPGFSVSYQGAATVKDYQISPENGVSLDLGYDYYLPSIGNASFSSSFPNIHGDVAYYLSGRPLPKHNVMSFKGSAWVAPQQPTIFTGATQAGGETFGAFYPPVNLVRGYYPGEFIGWTTYVGNFEYRFPISYPYEGYGTFPLFINKISGALVFDAITLQGGYYNSAIPSGQNNLLATTIGTFYTGTGAEVRFDTAAFYGIPIQCRVGAYYGLTQNAYGGFNYVVSLGEIQ